MRCCVVLRRLSPLFSLVFHRAAVLVPHWRGLTFRFDRDLASVRVEMVLLAL